jgi:hypothetical protein
LAKKEDLFDCLRCNEIGCFNLFKKSEDSCDAGHELQVYSVLGKKIEEKSDLSTCVCANGRFLTASCFLTVPIFEQKRSYLSEILIQVTRDFKASMFLAFSGHYRQANQVLRCAFESIISGAYFQSDLIALEKAKPSKEELDRLQKRFDRWKKDGRVNIGKSIEVLRRIGFLEMREEKEWKKLYSLLSKFVHTPKEFTPHMKHEEEDKMRVCPAATCFIERQLIEWSEGFQQVFAILLKTIEEFHPEAFRTRSGKVAITTCILPFIRGGYEDKVRGAKEIQSIISRVQESN